MLKSKVKEIYLHLDIDAVDPEEAPGVDFKAKNDLSSTGVNKAIKIIGENFHIKASALTAFNPDYDIDDKTLKIAIDILKYFVNNPSYS